MGKTLTGGTAARGSVDLLSPEQRQAFSSLISDVSPGVSGAFGQLLGPQTPESQQALFEQSYLQPAQQAFERLTVPGLQSTFADIDASSSSALNQALAQSAADLSTSIGSQFGQFQQGQRQQQLQALAQFLPLLTGQTFSPVLQQQQGILGPLIQSGAQIGSAAALSSRDVKENIKDYKKSIEALDKLSVKQYDYIEDVGGQKDKVGLIAEDVPKELTSLSEGILHVDLYGIMGLMINSIKALNKRLEKIEEVQ